MPVSPTCRLPTAAPSRYWIWAASHRRAAATVFPGFLRAPAYFTDRYRNEWGESINFDGIDATPVREFFVENAKWIFPHVD